jgi:hypothetical protein
MVRITDIAVVPPPPPPYPEPDGAVQVSVYVLLPAVVGVTTWVPVVASLPLHAPLALQVLAPVVDHISVAVWPTAIVVGCMDSVTAGPCNAGMVPPPPPHAANATLKQSVVPRDSQP